MKKDRYTSGLFSMWLREQDSNLRPSGYEPDELPCCSIPRQKIELYRYLKKLSSTLPLKFSKTLPIQSPDDKMSYSNIMILKSLNQKPTNQGYSELHRKSLNLKKPSNMVAPVFFVFSLLIRNLSHHT